MDDSTDYKGKNCCGRNHQSLHNILYFQFSLATELPFTATLQLGTPKYRKVGHCIALLGRLLKGSWLIQGAAFRLPSFLLCTTQNLNVMFRSPVVILGHPKGWKLTKKSIEQKGIRCLSLWMPTSHTSPALGCLTLRRNKYPSCLRHYSLEFSANKVEPTHEIKT